MHEELVLPSGEEASSTEVTVDPTAFFFEEKTAEENQDPTLNPAIPVEKDPEIFPPNIYTSARVKGARKVNKEDPRALDLRIEGLLFVTDAPLTIPQISSVLEVSPKRVMETLRDMIKSFSRRRSALELRERIRRGRPAFIIDLKAEYRPDVKPIARPALARRYIDTLALIALNQPVAQSRLVRERGSRVYDHVRTLMEHGVVARTKKGLSYELRTTPRFSSEFGLSANPKDLKAMLARAMTEEERENWAEYKRLNEAEKIVETSEEYSEATEQAARSLIVNNEISPQEEAVMSLPKGSEQSASPELVPTAHALEANAAEDTSPQDYEIESQSDENKLDSSIRSGRTSSGLNSLSYQEALGTTASGRVKKVVIHAEDDSDDQTPQLTRWEKLFLKLKQSND
jgi:segregation and condensation protein B